jgi:DNA repair protein RecO (recombination protein O)
MRLREADRIVHLYAAEHGRVNAVVKGVRRTRSRFGGRLEPFVRVRLVLYKGKGDLDTITQAQALEWYPQLRASGPALKAAGVACESMLRLFGDGEANRPAYNLLCHELQLLDSDPGAAGPANLLAFRIKLLLAAGFAPELGTCVNCGAELTDVPVGGFLLEAGGVVCENCAGSGSLMLDEPARSFMASALSAQLKETQQPDPRTLAQVDRAVTGTLEHHAHVTLSRVA